LDKWVNLNTAEKFFSRTGLQTATLGFGGGGGPPIQQLQKNMTEHLGQSVNSMNSKISLAGAGIQTAALAFGGGTANTAAQNLMMEQIGQHHQQV
jgi:hypothetical protein